MTATPDAADEGSDPRSVVDAVDRTAPMPVGLIGHGQIVEIEIVVLPRSWSIRNL
jgi:hypothetical protein